MSEIKPCRDCGSTDIPAYLARSYRWQCKDCYAAQRKKEYRRTVPFAIQRSVWGVKIIAERANDIESGFCEGTLMALAQDWGISERQISAMQKCWNSGILRNAPRNSLVMVMRDGSVRPGDPYLEAHKSGTAKGVSARP